MLIPGASDPMAPSVRRGLLLFVFLLSHVLCVLGGYDLVLVEWASSNDWHFKLSK